MRFGPGEAIEDDTFVLELRLGKLGKPAVVRAAALVAALTAEPETGTKQDIRNQWMRRREAVLS